VLSWKRANRLRAEAKLRAAAFLGLVAALVRAALRRDRDLHLVCIFGAAFVITTIVMEFARGIQARKSAETGALPGQVVRLVEKNKRRYGGYIVHSGDGGALPRGPGSSVFQKAGARDRCETASRLPPVPTRSHCAAWTDHQKQNASLTTAIVDVQRNGKFLATEHPSKAFYFEIAAAHDRGALHSTRWRTCI